MPCFQMFVRALFTVPARTHAPEHISAMLWLTKRDTAVRSCRLQSAGGYSIRSSTAAMRLY